MTGKLILTFIAMGIGVMVIAVDIAAVTVALPSVEKDFQTTIGTVEWVVNGYVLAWAVLMVTCGRLADMFGRKKIFFAGIVVFGAASLAGALAYNSNMLISARVVQGAGAALLWPAILGIVYSSVSEKQKGLAVGLILGAAGVGNAAGPLLGGFLTEFFSWRAVLYFNIPFALIAAVITYFVVKEKSTGESGGKIDYIGILTVSLSLVSLLYAVNQSPSWGWISGKTLALIAVFAVFLVVFILYERRTT
ncbi:MAG: MFS transporter, partial [Candidatus Dadabacteria bacterium]